MGMHGFSLLQVPSSPAGGSYCHSSMDVYDGTLRQGDGGHLFHAHQHASPDSTGTALRMLMERARVALQDGRRFEAMALVPDRPGSAWAGLTRHMAVVARLSGSGHMEESVLLGGGGLFATTLSNLAVALASPFRAGAAERPAAESLCGKRHRRGRPRSWRIQMHRLRSRTRSWDAGGGLTSSMAA